MGLSQDVVTKNFIAIVNVKFAENVVKVDAITITTIVTTEIVTITTDPIIADTVTMDVVTIEGVESDFIFLLKACKWVAKEVFLRPNTTTTLRVL